MIRLLVPTILSLLLCGQPANPTMGSLFNAVAIVESNKNDVAVGDNGKSFGRYQIQKPYWEDSRVPGEFMQVKDKEYAEKVMIAYWQRYCPTALANHDFEVLARVHNGGPKGHKKEATKKYWAKVRQKMRC